MERSRWWRAKSDKHGGIIAIFLAGPDEESARKKYAKQPIAKHYQKFTDITFEPGKWADQ